MPADAPPPGRPGPSDPPCAHPFPGSDRAPARLTRVVIEIEQHVAVRGWDQPPRLFALAGTVDLLAEEPQLAAHLGLAGAGVAAVEPGHLTPVEQEDLPPHSTLDELLAGITWPAQVLGAALVLERVLFPPDVEAGMPRDESAALRWIAEHPARQDVRIAVAVLRDGSRECALRLRAEDRDAAVVSGPDLVPGLARALAGTLAD